MAKTDYIVRAIPSSFVFSDMKLMTDKGAGEAKLFVGPKSKETEIDDFFRFGSGITYRFDKKNMLEALTKAGLIPNGLGVPVVNPIPNNPHQEIDEKVQSPIEIIEKVLGIKLISMNDTKEFDSYVKEKLEPKQEEPKPQRTKIVIDVENIENLTDSQLFEIIKKIKEKQ